MGGTLGGSIYTTRAEGKSLVLVLEVEGLLLADQLQLEQAEVATVWWSW